MYTDTIHNVIKLIHKIIIQLQWNQLYMSYTVKSITNWIINLIICSLESYNLGSQCTWAFPTECGGNTQTFELVWAFGVSVITIETLSLVTFYLHDRTLIDQTNLRYNIRFLNFKSTRLLNLIFDEGAWYVGLPYGFPI